MDKGFILNRNGNRVEIRRLENKNSPMGMCGDLLLLLLPETQLSMTNRATRLEVSQGHQAWYHSICYIWFTISVQSYNFVRKIWRYSTCQYSVTLKPGLGSLKVSENDTIRSDIHNILLTFYTCSNHRPILHRFRDKRRFMSEIANFPTPCILRPRLQVEYLEKRYVLGTKIL